ncbi:reverse transcriptase domain-containing protein [Streptomyces mirabilis]
MIPKAGGKKLRRLGIPTVRDRIVQAALKLVLEPIFEADFEPCSYGFRPNRRAHDAIAEIRTFASPPHRYEWVVEGDIAACFDEISHSALMGRMRQRISDKRVLMLVKAFLKAGILNKEGLFRQSRTGTPQGGILSPLLANVALSVLDEHFARRHREQRRMTPQQRRGKPSFRLIRYADLCRTRHTSHYVVWRVMPTAEAECPDGASECSATIGITGRLTSERFAEHQREPGVLQFPRGEPEGAVRRGSPPLPAASTPALPPADRPGHNRLSGRRSGHPQADCKLCRPGQPGDPCRPASTARRRHNRRIGIS